MPIFQKTISIFDFEDYRAFLRAKFEERKRLSDCFSHRYFAQKAGLHTPSFLQYVVQGKRNMTLESIRKFIRGFSLSEREGKYFELLVLFNQEASLPEKQKLYEQLLRLKSSVFGRKIDKQHYDYYSSWYIPVIREMASLPGFRCDPLWIQQRLSEKVSVPNIRKALAILTELKMIKQVSPGHWAAADPVVTTGPQVNSVQVANYHRQMISKAARSIDDVSPDNREITSLTASMSRACFEEIREQIREFKQQLMEKIINDKTPEQVYQINLNMFPFLKDEKRGNK